MISDEYRRLNKQLHQEKPGYGTGGARWAEHVLALCKEYTTDDVLDYGCGKSRLAAALGYPIKQYDPAIPEHAASPEPADIVVCTDVFEHIEPDQLDSVLDHLRQLTRKVALLNVSTRRANKSLPDGRNAHLIVKPFSWWLPKIQERFPDIEIVQESASEFTVYGS